MDDRFHPKIFWVILLITAGIITLNGILTDVSLGDESHHYHFAQNIYWAGKRVPFPSLYGSGDPPGFFYNDPPLWHFILAFLWKITGSVSQAVAQIYHSLFFILLVWVTSLLAREVSGEEGRWSSAFLLTTVPMVVSFSTLLYMDIPMAALSALSFYFILRRRYLEAGLAAGLAFFTKLNSGFFLPGFLLVIFWREKGEIWRLLKSVAFFMLPILFIYIPDAFWRKANLAMNVIGVGSISHRLSMAGAGFKLKEYLNSYMTRPDDFVKYFGVVLSFLIIFHFFYFKRWNKKGVVYWVPVISYLVVFFLLFGFVTDIRYIIPVVPFLVALVIPTFLSFAKKWRFVILVVCLLQFVATSAYVYQERKISPEIKEGFEFIRQNVPANALIFYPEENLLIYAQRKVIWSGVKVFRERLDDVSLKTIFWGRSTAEMNRALRVNEIDYILIKKSRIYDDREIRHYGGYPKSFVGIIPRLGGWINIFENSGVALWKGPNKGANKGE